MTATLQILNFDKIYIFSAYLWLVYIRYEYIIKSNDDR